MDTFLAPLPSPQPSFAAADDPELSSILASLLAMHDDDVREPPPPPTDEYLAADSATALPAFFVHQHDQPTSMSFPTVASRRPLPPPHTVDAHHEATATAGASRPVAKRKRRGKKPTSSPSESSTTRASRQVWVRARSTEWWDHLNGASCTDAEFRRAFRMSRATFGALCDALGGAVAREDTPLRAAIPLRRRVAACVWRLATAEPLREVSRRFGLGISTCHTIVLQVCHALAAVLLPVAIRWPDATAAAANVASFQAVSGGLPGVVGAVYTTRVPIVAPNKGNVAAYYDRRLTERSHKASYSVAVQVVSDADGAFTDVCIGFPGSLSDADVLARSALCQLRGDTGLLGEHGQRRLVGGAAYPLTDWMLVPYAAHRQDSMMMTWTQEQQRWFNDGVAAARDVARGAVRRLKARWRCLQRRSEAKMEDLPSLIAACCVLHNVCEHAGEGIDPDLMRYELDDDDDNVANDAAASSSSAAAVQVRTGSRTASFATAAVVNSDAF